MEEIEKEIEKGYIVLLRVLRNIAEANQGESAGQDNRNLYADGLLEKLCGHASSALYLFSQYKYS